MFDCPPSDFPPWRIQGAVACTRVRIEVNGEQTLCPASKAYWVRNAETVPTEDYEPGPNEGCLP